MSIVFDAHMRGLSQTLRAKVIELEGKADVEIFADLSDPALISATEEFLALFLTLNPSLDLSKLRFNKARSILTVFIGKYATAEAQANHLFTGPELTAVSVKIADRLLELWDLAGQGKPVCRSFVKELCNLIMLFVHTWRLVYQEKAERLKQAMLLLYSHADNFIAPALLAEVKTRITTLRAQYKRYCSIEELREFDQEHAMPERWR